MKKLITTIPILRSPDFARPFVLHTDASDYAIGAALMQEYDGSLFPVGFVSRKLQPREIRYSVVEKEALAFVFAFNKFDRFLFGKEFIVCTDNSALQYINNKKSENSRLLRWSLFLQNYKFTVKAIKGKENVLADFLSRM